jgi:hypothetical protein
MSAFSDSSRQYLERTHAGFELVGEAEEARLLAALNRYPSKLTWPRRHIFKRGRPPGAQISSPCGLIEVWADIGFAVLRNDAFLYHDSCRTKRGGGSARRPSEFLSLAAAQAAAELHLALGWGEYARAPGCMPFEWDNDNVVSLDGRTPRREPILTRLAHPAAVDDNHIFRCCELRECSEPWGYPFYLAWNEQARFANHIPHPGVQHFRWRKFANPPAWQHAAQGWFALKTPYGELVVRRVNNAGWIVERNGRALCYGPGADNLANLKVVLDDYRDAQTLALMWVFPWRVLLTSLSSYGYRSLKDSILHWSDEPPALAAA